MSVPAGCIIAWPNTAASIPGGWTRLATLDSKYPKHLITTGTTPGGTGGNATHIHTAPAHSHTVVHGHTAPVTATETGDQTSVAGQTGGGNTAIEPHTHPPSVTSTTVTSATTALTWDAAPPDPSYYTVVWIQSDGTPTGIPQNALVFWASQTAPVNFAQHVGSKGRFLRGAAAGLDGGATGGGSHSHTSATAHTHTIAAGHTHTGGSGAPTGTIISNIPSGAPGTSLAQGGHQHTLTAASTTPTLGTTASAASGATATTPPYVTLLAIQQQNATPQQPVGLVCLWLGTLASIPAGWSQLTSVAVDRFLRAANVTTEVLGTGGALGHSHGGAAGHTHAQSHSHTLSTGASNSNAGIGILGGSASFALPTHTHTVGASGTDATAASSVAATADTLADDRPPFVEVALIQFGGVMTVGITSPAGGAVLSSPSPTVAWALSGSYVQNDYRLYAYAADGVTVVYDSGIVAASTLSATIPSGYLLNGQTYVLRVVVDDTAADNAVSPAVTVTTSWADVPAVTGLTATAVGGTP